MIHKTWFIPAILALLITSPSVYAAPPMPGPGQLAASDRVDTSTDFLSDDEWRRLPRERRRARWMRQTLTRYEPTGTTSPERLATYIERFRQMNVYDRRLYVYNVTASLEAGSTAAVVLTGEVSVPQYKTGTERILRELGFNVVRNDIHSLPDEKLGHDIYGVATTSVATIRKEPRMRAEQVNSVPMGGWVRILREARASDITVPPFAADDPEYRLQNSWMLAQTLEGYFGFIQTDHFVRKEKIQLPDAMVMVPTTITLSVGSVVLPVGSYVYSAGNGYKVYHTDSVLPAETVVVSVNHPRFNEEDILKLMTPLTNVTKYVWGGVTHEGIDCSGFTQLLFRMHGIYIPRDAEEQATVGQIVAFGPEAAKLAQPGDLFFFTNDSGRIGHVGISLGNGRLIHSSNRPGVAVQDLGVHDDDDERSLADRIIFARRIMSR